MNETRVRIYERLMEAEERIAHSRYRRGVSDQSVLAAMDAAEKVPSEAELRDNLYLSSLAAYVQALGGHLEIRAVFPDETIGVQPDLR